MQSPLEWESDYAVCARDKVGDPIILYGKRKGEKGMGKDKYQ